MDLNIIAAKTSFSVENQRSVIKFLFLRGFNAAAIRRDLVKVLGKEAFDESTVRYWCKKFENGNWSVEDHRGGDYTSGPQTDERLARITEALEESRAWTMRSLSAHTGIPRNTCHLIVTKKLEMKKIMKKWVPHELTPGQMEMRMVYSECNLRNYNQQKTRLEHTVAIDETWVSLCRPPEKDQAKEWLQKGESSTSVAVLDRFGPKVLLILAMDVTGICYYEILPEKETLKGPRYLEFLRRLMDKWHGNRQHRVWLLDDNAKPHRSAAIIQWIEGNQIERWFQPPYSPDLSPCDFGCFHPLKRAIGGQHYPNIEALQIAIDNEVRCGNANGTYLAVQKLPERWLQCVNNKGEYL